MKPLLDSQTLAQLQLLDESAMNEMFLVTYTTSVSDEAGGSTETTTVITTMGYLWSVSGDEAGTDQIRAQGRHRIAVPKALSVPATARMTQVSSGKAYAVKYPFPISSYSTSRIVGVEDAT